ncbi:metallophosphoesterase [Labrys sedimenti]|uniref:metallophosphoesterase n=1 Tax=Labrys sedimenti TaxID=3106036 RepID=UPI002ACADD75|nr:metallophosphoesterase [Labrys sp. ZIDIC5]MDZ5453068.1 metallophosphoesterase [Labrys sp. ZIDIC5]
MRLWVLSDLHVDNSPYTLAPTPIGADAVIIAGDVCNRLHDRALPWLAQHVLPRGLPLIYVPGNHDFYRENVETELRKARDRARLEGIHLLAEGETLTAGGVRFIGATLWTDYAVGGSSFLGQVAAGMQMNDHKLIRTGPNYRRWQTRDALLSHGRHRSAIANTLAQPFDGPSVVISHHAPHPHSLWNNAVTEPIDAAYASDLTSLIAEYRPRLWVHGHIHASRDYRVHETRIVSNPRGNIYAYRRGKQSIIEVENPDHDPSLTVEV